MSVQTQIDRIQQNVTDTYSALEEMGATMPTEQNSDNMAATVLTVPRGGGGTSVQSDWNQTDETAADFIKNKPFGDVPTVILEEQELVVDENEGACFVEAPTPIQAGDILIVKYNGTNYECDVITAEGICVFGNAVAVGFAETSEPFCGLYMDGMIIVIPLDGTTPSMQITRLEPIKIKERYYVTKLYFMPNDKYLYTNVNCTTKATLRDIPDNSEFSVGLSNGGSVAMWLRTAIVFGNVVSMSLGYCHIVVQNGSQFIDLYTAEYTPET